MKKENIKIFVAQLLSTAKGNIFLEPFAFVGRSSITICDEAGKFVIFCVNVAKQALKGIFIKNFFSQFIDVAFYSIFLISITGFFSGAVLALQSYSGLDRFGATDSVAPIVILSLSRELGPVLSALMMISRVASRMAAELGGMVITSQISAMQFLGVHPIRFLIVPRVLAATIAAPILSMIFTVIGCFGGYIVCVYALGFPSTTTITMAINVLKKSDIYIGLAKTVFFGLSISLIACYLGYSVSGGTDYVGLATTRSVVISSVSIVLLNYVLTSLWF